MPRRETSSFDDSTIEIELEHAKSRRRRQFLEAAGLMKSFDDFPATADEVLLEILSPLRNDSDEIFDQQQTSQNITTHHLKEFKPVFINESKFNGIHLADSGKIPEVQEPHLNVSVVPLQCIGQTINKHEVTSKVLKSLPDSQRVESDFIPAKIKRLGKRQRRMRKILKNAKDQRAPEEIEVQVLN